VKECSVAQSRVQWRTFVNAGKNLQFPLITIEYLEHPNDFKFFKKS
jgi:hypothetical protein